MPKRPKSLPTAPRTYLDFPLENEHVSGNGATWCRCYVCLREGLPPFDSEVPDRLRDSQLAAEIFAPLLAKAHRASPSRPIRAILREQYGELS